MNEASLISLLRVSSPADHLSSGTKRASGGSQMPSLALLGCRIISHCQNSVDLWRGRLPAAVSHDADAD